MLKQVGKSLGRFEIYTQLYPFSARLESAVVTAYDKFLRLCLGMFKAFTSGKKKKERCECHQLRIDCMVNLLRQGRAQRLG
jgi:hypothetical protein